MVFENKELSSFLSEMLRTASLLLADSFFTSLGITPLNYDSASNIREVMKFCKLGDKRLNGVYPFPLLGFKRKGRMLSSHSLSVLRHACRMILKMKASGGGLFSVFNAN